METDKENTSSYLQTSSQSPALASYDGCNTRGVSRAKTMRPLTAGTGSVTSESEVAGIVVNFYFCSFFLFSISFNNVQVSLSSAA